LRLKGTPRPFYIYSHPPPLSGRGTKPPPLGEVREQNIGSLRGTKSLFRKIFPLSFEGEGVRG